jgi:hypothetical protein
LFAQPQLIGLPHELAAVHGEIVHTQAPATQEYSEGQAFLQLPQWFTLVCTLTHVGVPLTLHRFSPFLGQCMDASGYGRLAGSLSHVAICLLHRDKRLGLRWPAIVSIVIKVKIAMIFNCIFATLHLKNNMYIGKLRIDCWLVAREERWSII